MSSVCPAWGGTPVFGPRSLPWPLVPGPFWRIPQSLVPGPFPGLCPRSFLGGGGSPVLVLASVLVLAGGYPSQVLGLGTTPGARTGTVGNPLPARTRTWVPPKPGVPPPGPGRAPPPRPGPGQGVHPRSQ